MSSFKMPGEAWATVESLCEELVRRERIAVDELTQKQIASALRQAIACGDFIRQVRVDNRAQTVVYIPFDREQKLEQRIAELESVLAQARFEAARRKVEHPSPEWESIEYFLRDPKSE